MNWINQVILVWTPSFDAMLGALKHDSSRALLIFAVSDFDSFVEFLVAAAPVFVTFFEGDFFRFSVLEEGPELVVVFWVQDSLLNIEKSGGKSVSNNSLSDVCSIFHGLCDLQT